MEGEQTVVLDLDGVLFRLPFDFSINFRKKKVSTEIRDEVKGIRKLLQRIFWSPLIWGWPIRRINRTIVEQILDAPVRFKFVAVTNRRPHLRAVTEDLLRRAGLGNLEVTYCDGAVSSAIEKLKRAQELEALCVVEDDFGNLEYLATNGVNTILLRRWYNKPDVLYPGMFWVNDDQLLGVFDDFLEEIREGR